MGVQLYPPVIPNVLNAMYNDGADGIAIAIPFSLNRAVSANQIQNFCIQIKTVFDNQIQFRGNIVNIVNYGETTGHTTDYENIQAIEAMKAEGVIRGHLPTNEISRLMPGQYYKIQVAFVNAEEVYELTHDFVPDDNKQYYQYTEQTNQYNAVDIDWVYDHLYLFHTLYEKTWKETEGIMSSVATIKYTIRPIVDIYGFETPETSIDNDNPPLVIYDFEYTYKGKFDNSEDPSETRDQYIFQLFDTEDDNNPLFESGWLFKDPYKDDDEYTFIDIPENTEYRLRYGVKTINGVEAYSDFYHVQKVEVIPSELDGYYNLIAKNNFDNGYNKLNLELIDEEAVPTLDGMFRVLRRSDPENLWDEITRIHLSSAANDNHNPSFWIFKDFLIEQGQTYYYAIQQYNQQNIYSTKMITDPIIADFEDIFLYDGEKQLKIRFNPKVSSIKINRQEQKLETIGSQFPFFVRNGKIAYHEFPIAGLISYWMDEEELFMTDAELGLESLTEPIRNKTAEDQTIEAVNRRGRTLSLQGYNFMAERRFKDTVLNWLGNGKPKFYKSPAEGNFIIRIMNPSLTPEDKVSRMIHNFSSTAYEAMEINQDNLFNFGFINKDIDIFNKITTEVFNNIKTVVMDYYDKTKEFDNLHPVKNAIYNNFIFKRKQIIENPEVEDWGTWSNQTYTGLKFKTIIPNMFSIYYLQENTTRKGWYFLQNDIGGLRRATTTVPLPDSYCTYYFGQKNHDEKQVPKDQELIVSPDIILTYHSSIQLHVGSGIYFQVSYYFYDTE